MAELTIQLCRNASTGKHDIIIKLHSEPDTLPQEHERIHREQVARLLGKDLSELGELVIIREDKRVVIPNIQSDVSQQRPIAQVQQ